MTSTTHEQALTGFRSILSEAASLAKNARSCHAISRKLAKPEGYADLKSLSRDLDKLANLSLEAGDLVERAQSAASLARAWLADEWERRASEFAGELVEYFGERGIEAQEMNGGVAIRPFAITLDTAMDRAELLFAGEPVGKTLPLDADRIFRAYADALTHLEREQTPPEVFADALIEAYGDALQRKRVREEGRIRLPDVHFALFVRRQTSAGRSDPRRGRLKEYPRYQFAWDLSLLRQHHDWLTRDARRIVLHPASASVVNSKSKAESVRTLDREGSEIVLGDVQVVSTSE